MHGTMSKAVGGGLVVALAVWLPMAVEAQSAQGTQHGLALRVQALETEVATLKTTVATLKSDVATLKANTALDLGQFVSVKHGVLNNLAGPHVIFTGANIHIQSGLGQTCTAVNGLGNLVVGYNEALPEFGDASGARAGSHNLVVGEAHSYTNCGGFVAGEFNTISGQAASVSGGGFNTASGMAASVSGGGGNTASGQDASVSGGKQNTASGVGASVSGGVGNTASGFGASVSGGKQNTASGGDASVSGGAFNTASGDFQHLP